MHSLAPPANAATGIWRRADAASRPAPDAHVRAVDREARRLVDTAARCSATVQQSLETLEASDLVVLVETMALDKKMHRS